MAGNSVYPGAIDPVTVLPVDVTNDTDAGDGTPRTGTTGWLAQLLNDHSDAIRKLELELGVDPAGAFVDVVTRLAARQTCRKSADQSFTTQTPANVTDMSFAVAASQDYYFKFVLGVTMGAARGVEVALTCPASPTFLVAKADIYGQVTTAGSTDAVVGGLITASGGVVSHTPTAGATTSMVVVEGILSNGVNAGTLQLQASQGNGATAVNVVVKKGSYGELYLN
jgi:hypothetical protein